MKRSKRPRQLDVEGLFRTSTAEWKRLRSPLPPVRLEFVSAPLVHRGGPDARTHGAIATGALRPPVIGPQAVIVTRADLTNSPPEVPELLVSSVLGRPRRQSVPA